MFQKILAALVLAFAFLFSLDVAAQQPGGDGTDDGGSGKSPCDALKECLDRDKPKHFYYRCGEGTEEEGQVLVDRACTCKEAYRNHVVHDASHPGTLVCVAKSSIWDAYDALEGRATRLENGKADKSELEALKKDYTDFKNWIIGLGLEDFIRGTNNRLTKIDDRLTALETRVTNVENGQKATDAKVDKLAKSVVQVTIGVEGGGNYRNADGGDENGTGKFGAGAGYFDAVIGLEGYFTDIFGLQARLKAGLMAGEQTNGLAGQVGGELGVALRFEPVYVDFGPAWYTLAVGHHTDAGGEGNFRGWGLGGEVGVGVRPIPQLEVGGRLFVGGGHNGSAEIPVEGNGVWIQGGLFLEGVLGVVDSDEAK